MKNLPLVLLTLGLAVAAVPVRAATLTFDANLAAAGAQDGSGPWNTTTANWYNGSGDVVWPNATDTAAFGAGGTSGTVTLAGTVNVGALTLGQGGYNLTAASSGGGILNFKSIAATTPIVITTSGAGQVTKINNFVGFTATNPGQLFTKTGPGTLNVSTANSTATVGFSSPTWTIAGGTMSGTEFDSIVQIGGAVGRLLGTGGTIALNAGSVELNVQPATTTFTGSSLAGPSRAFTVGLGGGAIVDASTGTTGTPTSNNTVDAAIANNAGGGSSLYLSNGKGIVTKFTGIISGTGSVTWNGAGTAILAGANTYTGSTVVNGGTLQLTGGSLGSNSVSVAAGATLSLQNAVFKFTLGSTGADQLMLQAGSFAVSGSNTVRLATGGTLALGAFPLINAPAGNVTGNFQIDGGNTLLVPAPSLIKLVGGTFYRLTLQNSSTAEQVTVTPAPAKVMTIMALGSSITRGYGGDPTLTGCGYRSELYQRLVNDGRFTPNFIGSQTVPVPGTTPAGYDVLIGANQVFNEGHSGYTTSDLMENINAYTGNADANGGFWLKPGNGLNPDYITLNIGGNDYVYNHGETTGPVNRVDAILTTLQTLRPNATVVSSNLLYRPDAGAYEDAQFNPRIQGVIYNHVLAGHHVVFADVYGAVTPNDSVTLMGPPDQTHPSLAGYPVMGNVFFNSVVYGSAYWTGAQDGRWSTVAAGGATNFAQDYQRTTDRQAALDAATDVYFNGNTAALPTTLGQDQGVRGLNFAAGAAGPVSVGGTNTLTVGAGGLTVQAGTGMHTLSANVVLGADQTWGNVSSNPLLVSGTVSGAHALTVTGSCTIQTQVAATGNTTASQTYAGTGAIVLSGMNTYSGGTTVGGGGTLMVNGTGGSGTGSGAVSVLDGSTLTNNGYIGGDVGLSGVVNGSGGFGGAVTVNAGGSFGGASINGALNVGAGGLVMLSGGTLSVGGVVTNNGTVRLAHGASLVAGSSGGFINNGLLDVITGSFSAPGGFTNHGVVLDSSVVQARSATFAAGTFTVTVDGYGGHTYQLQRSDALAGGSYANVGAPQSGTTGTALSFSDNAPAASQGFYRVQVDP